MEFLQGFGGFSAEVVTGHFGFGVAPGDNYLADLAGGQLGLAFGTTDTEAGGPHAGMSLSAVKRFARATPGAFDDVDGPVHQKPPWPSTLAAVTWAT